MNTSTLNDTTGAEVWDDPGLGRRALTWLRGDPRAALSLVVLVVILGAALLAFDDVGRADDEDPHDAPRR